MSFRIPVAKRFFFQNGRVVPLAPPVYARPVAEPSAAADLSEIDTSVAHPASDLLPETQGEASRHAESAWLLPRSATAPR